MVPYYERTRNGFGKLRSLKTSVVVEAPSPYGFSVSFESEVEETLAGIGV